jgi:hypothetical protein
MGDKLKSIWVNFHDWFGQELKRRVAGTEGVVTAAFLQKFPDPSLKHASWLDSNFHWMCCFVMQLWCI